MCVALMGLCASAQEKGDMAVGLNLGAAPVLESGYSVTNFGIGAKFQYHFSTPARIEIDADYWLKAKGCEIYDFSANFHYLFNVGSKLKVYPIVGIGYAGLKGTGTNEYNKKSSGSVGRFLVNVGAGAEYPISERLAVGAEIKYQYMKDFNRLPISVGVTYKF